VLRPSRDSQVETTLNKQVSLRSWLASGEMGASCSTGVSLPNAGVEWQALVPWAARSATHLSPGVGAKHPACAQPLHARPARRDSRAGAAALGRAGPACSCRRSPEARISFSRARGSGKNQFSADCTMITKWKGSLPRADKAFAQYRGGGQLRNKDQSSRREPIRPRDPTSGHLLGAS